MHLLGGMPLSIFAIVDSVMTRPVPVRCGKWPGSVSADPGCARIIGEIGGERNPPAEQLFGGEPTTTIPRLNKGLRGRNAEKETSRAGHAQRQSK
jgi:hypothetical protein